MRQRLTDKGIRGLKAPAEGQIDIWDQVLPGFGVRVGYGGRKAFIVGTRINGKFRRITLKPAYPHLELAEARSQAKQIIADAQAGIGPDERKKRDAKKSFRAVADAFMVAHGNKLRTRKEVRRKIDIDLRAWHDLQISDIKREDIQELVREGGNLSDRRKQADLADHQDIQLGCQGKHHQEFACGASRSSRRGDRA